MTTCNTMFIWQNVCFNELHSFIKTDPADINVLFFFFNSLNTTAMRASCNLKGSTSQLLCTLRFQAAQQLPMSSSRRAFRTTGLGIWRMQRFHATSEITWHPLYDKNDLRGWAKILFYFLSNADLFLLGFSLNETFTAHNGPFRNTVEWMATAKFLNV